MKSNATMGHSKEDSVRQSNVIQWLAFSAFCVFGLLGAASQPPGPGSHAHFAVLTGEWRVPAPFASVDMVYGPREVVNGTEFVWWQLQARREPDPKSPPMFTLRALTDADPLADGRPPLLFHRYILQFPGTQQVLEYRDIHSGHALLPAWKDFTRYFVPRAARGTHRQNGLPETACYLGHTLTLLWTGSKVPWQTWESVQRLDLDRELLVGTGRSFRDAELKRLPQTPERQNYTYTPFVQDEYKTMIEAGINLFTVGPEQTGWVQDQPVFYIRGVGRNVSLSYPTDLYRSNYLGSVMFMDEPAIIMVGDKLVHNTLRHFADATNLLGQRVRSRYYSGANYSAFSLEQDLKTFGVHFGDMRLEQWDYPAWETMYQTAFYQLEAGLAGVVHEGRYRLDEFDQAIAKWTNPPRKHTAREMLQYHYGILRGAARQTGKHWGTSIYGQADPKLSPLAVTLAYDMGARYVWFWTSDHDHHLPWPEQLELARILKAHAGKNRRNSIYHSPAPVLDTAIVIPYGYFLELGNLWWIRALDVEGKNEHSQRFARLMRSTHAQIHQAMDRGDDFDVLIDTDQPVTGYRKLVRVTDR